MRGAFALCVSGSHPPQGVGLSCVHGWEGVPLQHAGRLAACHPSRGKGLRGTVDPMGPGRAHTGRWSACAIPCASRPSHLRLALGGRGVPSGSETGLGWPLI